VHDEPTGDAPVARARLWRWTLSAVVHRYGAHARTDARRWLVELADGVGHTGWGEAAPLSGFGGEAPDACEASLVRALGDLPGVALPRAPVALAERIASLGLPRFASAAVECAAADLVARRAGEPLARWLDPRATSTVVVSALAGDLGDDQVHARAAQWCERGVRTLKLKVLADGWPAQLVRLRALRAAHPSLALRLDANGTWSLADWRARAAVLGDLAIEHVEQPFAAGDHDALALAARGPGPGIALDESLCASATDVERLLAQDPDVCYVLKPAVLGVVGAWRLAQRVASRRAIASHFADGPVGRSSARALAQVLAVRDPALAHGVAPELDGADRILDGTLVAPRGAGLAVEPDLAAWREVGRCAGSAK